MTSAQEYSTKHVTEITDKVLHDQNHLRQHFEDEANFVAYKRQIHAHSATCVKYSFKNVLPTTTSTKNSKKHVEYPCRFKAPWPLEENTHFSNEGLLRHRRNHRMVNAYNQAMAIGLRHNHDIAMICSKTHSLSMLFYITNYATKLETPMWKRLAIAQEYKMLADQHSDFLANPPVTAEMERDLYAHHSLLRAPPLIFFRQWLKSILPTSTKGIFAASSIRSHPQKLTTSYFVRVRRYFPAPPILSDKPKKTQFENLSRTGAL